MQVEIHSGAQTGSDLAALNAAKACNCKTGGWMTKGCKTLDGPKREYLELYEMKEHPSPNYKDRTWANVRDTDGTIRIASNFSSLGEICTLKAIKAYKKPYLDIDINKTDVTMENIVRFIKENNIRKLNVAGNSEKTSPGIEKIAFNIIFALLQHLATE